jgi:WD40-like Beta Propeller Repeat
MSSELDLRGLHQPHEPDPAFIDALEQRIEAILTDATGDAPVIEDASVIEDGDTVNLYVRAPVARPERGRWFSRAVLGAAAAVVLAAVVGVIVRRDEHTSVEPTTAPIIRPAANGWVAQNYGTIIILGRADSEVDIAVDGDACPAFSPDGEQLMYGRDVGESAYLDVVNIAAEGTEVSPGIDGQVEPPVSLRSTIPLDGVIGIPCALWAPDGRWAALADGGTVWIVDTETGEVRQLPGYAPTDLEWRPGTDQLAINGRSDSGGDNTPIDIYTVSTGEVRTLGDVEAEEFTWSPDGTTLAYTQAVPGAANTMSGITLIDADGTNQRPLTTVDYAADHGIGVVWSPRGNQIAYQRERTDCTGPGCFERTEVVLVTATDDDPDTPIGTERAIPPLPDDLYGPDGLHAEPWFAKSVTWSPDGTKLLYSAEDEALIVVPVDPTRPAIVLSNDGLIRANDEYATIPRVPIQEWQPVR